MASHCPEPRLGPSLHAVRSLLSYLLSSPKQGIQHEALTIMPQPTTPLPPGCPSTPRQFPLPCSLKWLLSGTFHLQIVPKQPHLLLSPKFQEDVKKPFSGLPEEWAPTLPLFTALELLSYVQGLGWQWAQIRPSTCLSLQAWFRPMWKLLPISHMALLEQSDQSVCRCPMPRQPVREARGQTTGSSHICCSPEMVNTRVFSQGDVSPSPSGGQLLRGECEAPWCGKENTDNTHKNPQGTI